MSMHLYRGFEIYPLIYPHVSSQHGNPHNYENGFDAAVKICLRGTADRPAAGRRLQHACATRAQRRIVAQAGQPTARHRPATGDGR